MRRLHLQTLALALLGAGVSLDAPVARAEDAPRPRAAFAIAAPADVDPFIPAYIFQVGATVLHNEGFLVAPPNIAAERLRSAGNDVRACVADERCAERLARQLDVPVLVLAEATAARRRIVLHAVAFTFIDGEIERVSELDATGGEQEIAARVRDFTAALTRAPHPCTVDVRGPPGVNVDVAIAGVANGPPRFLRPGPREMVVRAHGRDPWRGTLRCEPGRRYRIHVR